MTPLKTLELERDDQREDHAEQRSLLVAAERHESVVQVRTVVLLALLAIVRKLIIFDLSKSDAYQLFALAAAALALGAVYWLVRDQDARQRAAAAAGRQAAEDG